MQYLLLPGGGGRAGGNSGLVQQLGLQQVVSCEVHHLTHGQQLVGRAARHSTYSNLEDRRGEKSRIRTQLTDYAMRA